MWSLLSGRDLEVLALEDLKHSPAPRNRAAFRV
jgi:hypothetical protein